jgi:hypothetical protein
MGGLDRRMVGRSEAWQSFVIQNLDTWYIHLLPVERESPLLLRPAYTTRRVQPISVKHTFPVSGDDYQSASR